MSLLGSRTVHAVLFDIDDTLIDYLGARRRGIVDYVTGLGIAVDEETLSAEWLRLEDMHFRRFLAGELSWIDQRRARLRDLLSWLGATEPAGDDETDTWFARFWALCERAIAPFADVEPCLAGLAGPGVPVGVVTNNVDHVARTKLAAAGLTDRFPVLVGTSSGHAKPDPRIFQAGCAALGVAPEHTAYVGDRLDTDAIAAMDAGLIGVWLDRTKRVPEEPVAVPAGVIRIGSLAEL